MRTSGEGGRKPDLTTVVVTMMVSIVYESDVFGLRDLLTHLVSGGLDLVDKT